MFGKFFAADAGARCCCRGGACPRSMRRRIEPPKRGPLARKSKQNIAIVQSLHLRPRPQTPIVSTTINLK